jgi:hypothetical protein
LVERLPLEKKLELRAGSTLSHKNGLLVQKGGSSERMVVPVAASAIPG